MSREPIHVSPETHDRVLALTNAFVASLPHAEIVALIETGPRAVARRCFAWAFDAVRELDVVGGIDPTRSASLESAAPWVKLLQKAAIDRIELVHGTAVAPVMPSLPDGVTPWATSQLECVSRRMGRRARYLCSTTVYTRMGGGDSMAYFLTEYRARRAWNLWLAFDCDLHGRVHRLIVASCPRRKDVPERHAAMFLVQAFWSTLHASYGWGEPDEWCGGELLSADALHVIADTIWPPKPKAS